MPSPPSKETHLICLHPPPLLISPAEFLLFPQIGIRRPPILGRPPRGPSIRRKTALDLETIFPPSALIHPKRCNSEEQQVVLPPQFALCHTLVPRVRGRGNGREAYGDLRRKGNFRQSQRPPFIFCKSLAFVHWYKNIDTMT